MIPWTAASAFVLLGVVACDLVFDLGRLEPLTVCTYYLGQRTSSFKAIDATIVIGAIPLLQRLWSNQRTVYDWATLALFCALLVMFVVVLIPAQEYVMGFTTAEGAGSDEVGCALATIRGYHLGCFAGFIAVIVCQVRSFQTTGKEHQQ